MVNHSPAAHSAQIALQLEMAGRCIPLSQIGPGYVVCRQGIDLPAGDARIVMTVDGVERVWNVLMPHGAVPFDPTIQVTPQ